MKLLPVAVAALLAGPALAQAPAAGPATVEDVKVNQLIVYGTDACPPSGGDEIIVCARKPEGDRFRIPENLRDIENPANNSWANRAIELSYVGREGIGSCSPTGPGGQIGCLNQLIDQAQAERSGADEVNWSKLIQDARQERLGRIDDEAAQAEREQNPPR